MSHKSYIYQGIEPFISTSYDTSPLTDGELLHLSTWVENPRKEQDFAVKLSRIHTPLHDFYSQFPIDHISITAALRLTLRRMHQTHTLFWQWYNGDWFEFIYSLKSNYEKKAMPLIIAMAHSLNKLGTFQPIEKMLYMTNLAKLMLGTHNFNDALGGLVGALESLGYKMDTLEARLRPALAAVMLHGNHKYLKDITEETLYAVSSTYCDGIARHCGKISSGLAALGYLDDPIRMRHYIKWRDRSTEGVHPQWAELCQRWRDTSTLTKETRESAYSHVLRTGLWLNNHYPDIIAPDDWTPVICGEYIAAIDRMVVGEWQLASSPVTGIRNHGQPVRPNTKRSLIGALRRFFIDIEYWGWVKLRINPYFHLATPRSITKQTGTNPRTVNERIWLKLVWASLNLTSDDMLSEKHYPFELIKAMAGIWTHAGLRQNEIFRLRLGCITPQTEQIIADDGTVTESGSVCFLHVPAGKTFKALSKPVAPVIAEMVAEWEHMRPKQGTLLDKKTSETVSLLFQFRGRMVGHQIINDTIIPILCQKAGVPSEDSKGRITSHRARASIITNLASSPQGLSLHELMRWAGHSCARSTMHYLEIKPTRLAASFVKADGMAHMIELLIDHEVIASGKAAEGEAYKFYDLGDSYCTNPFWSTCAHRMACARCDFNLPKSSAKAAALEAKSSVQRLLEEVPLTEEEYRAASGDLDSLNALIGRIKHTDKSHQIR